MIYIKYLLENLHLVMLLQLITIVFELSKNGIKLQENI